MTGENAILEHLDAGGTVVTATRRQARLLGRRHDAAQRAAGRRVWRSADVLPLEAWLERCWWDVAESDSPRLLGVAQATWRWRRAVRGHADDTLIGERDLAAAARAAWVSLVAHGGGSGDLVGLTLSRDQQAFQGWATAVERDLRSHGWLDPAQLPDAVAAHAARFGGGARLLFVGFLNPTAPLRGLAAAVTRAGGEARFHPGGSEHGRATGFAAEHPADELEAILDWVAATLDRDPEACLGVVIPDLAARAGALRRAFDSAVQPSLELPGALERNRRVDFAGGPPLAHYRVVGDALAGLSPGPLTVETASRLLRSPYLGDAAERESRLRLDLRLRASGTYLWDDGRLTDEARAAGCPSVAAALLARSELSREPLRRPPSEWASVFGRLLEAWGWPARRPLASDEFQVAQRFREALASLAALDPVAPPLSAAEARLELLEAGRAAFQPERGDAQVLVYDAFEPPGLVLDGLWISGLTASAWPRPPAPDPFLPAAVQRRLGMPAASAESTREEALAVTDAWLRTAPDVVFSWPLRQDDAEAEASRLLPAGLPTHPRRPRRPSRERRLWEGAEREPPTADPAPPADPASARGGARLLELQSKCPFRAFAELRLGARPLDEAAPGLDRRVRGIVLHAAVERAWRELGGSAGLAALDAVAREELVVRCVSDALSAALPAAAGAEAARLEAEWQMAALRALLDADAARGTFEIESLERPFEAVLAGLPLRLRIDRVDRTPAGLVVIDYKTGEARVTQWRGTRPDAPQLPLYAALAGDEVAAVAFAVVRPTGVAYRGVGEEAVGVPGLTAAERFRIADSEDAGLSWAELRTRWGAWLAKLAEQYLAGVADVAPKQPTTCRLCHLGTLCRVDRRPAEDEDEGLHG